MLAHAPQVLQPGTAGQDNLGADTTHFASNHAMETAPQTLQSLVQSQQPLLH